MVVAVNYKWVLISGGISLIEMELFLDRQKRWKKKTSQPEPCQVCPVHFAEHTMHYAIYKCNAPSCAERTDPCNWYLRTTLCDITQRGTIEQHGHHISSVVEERGKKLNLQMKRFISEKVKEKFKPSRILNAMIDSHLLETEAAAFLRPVTRYAYHYRTRGLSDNNDVSGTEQILANRHYHPDLPETAPFGFAFSTDERGKPTLSRGTAQRPVVVGFTTKTMLRNVAYAKDHVLHVDATFKLNTAGFPSVIFGVSDVRRHSIFETFKMYQMVTENVASIGYAMADADVAQRNALEVVVTQELKQAVPPVYLMCFFHVMQNVRKYIASVPPALHRKIHKQVYRIHYARPELDLDRRIAEAVSEWKSDPALRDFERRFSQQWLAGRFTRWQCLATPAGFAKTNNPVEQFNKEIKRDYSLRSLLSKGGRLSVSSHYRASVAFLMECNERQILRVSQSGFDALKPTRKKPLTTKEEVDRADQDVETDGQPTQG
ncbi:hypothetical protein BBJ28_00011561 [Nothophytophthora sp. Chile5]|nr:hypothetical protein BBJ28_00011561 [Nothophytophthora sp. Chile5]